MSVIGIVLTASLAQNVILVHYLGVWPLSAVVHSPRRASILSIAITGALLWTSLLFWLVRQTILIPLDARFLETLALTTILALSTIAAIRVGSQIAPFQRKRILQAAPAVFVNTTVFVVSMGMVRSVESLGHALLGAFAAGIGLFIAVVPLSAVRVHFETVRRGTIFRGDVAVYLATALMALAIQQIDRLLHTFFIPLY